MGAWLLDGAHYYVSRPAECASLPRMTRECRGLRVVTKGHAAAYLGTFLANAIIVSTAAFRRRDVP